MLTYKHILLATDLSDQAENAAKTAFKIAEKSKAKLSMVHVLEHTPIIYGGGEFSIPIDLSLEEQLGKQAKAALAELGDRYHVELKDQYIVHGSVKREIIDLSTHIHADLIVVSSHGHSGVATLLGSTANAVLHAAICDVLAVRC